MRQLLIIPLCLPLLACDLPTEEERIEGYRATCAGYGFEPGTPYMANCVQRAVEARREALIALGESMRQQSEWQRAQAQQYRAPTTTTCTPMGYSIRCSSF